MRKAVDTTPYPEDKNVAGPENFNKDHFKRKLQ